LLDKALTRSKPEDLSRDEALDLIYWVRIMIGAIVGTAAGVLGLQGMPVLIVFGASLFVLSWAYYSRFLEIDESDFNEQELLMEGMANALAIFMLTWILISSFK